MKKCYILFSLAALMLSALCFPVPASNHTTAAAAPGVIHNCDDIGDMDTLFVYTNVTRRTFIEGKGAFTNTKGASDGLCWMRNASGSPLSVDVTGFTAAGSAVTFYLYLEAADIFITGEGLPQFALGPKFSENFEVSWELSEWKFPAGQTALRSGWNYVVLPMKGGVNMNNFQYFQLFVNVKEYTTFMLDDVRLTAYDAGSAITDSRTRKAVILDDCDSADYLDAAPENENYLSGAGSLKRSVSADKKAVFKNKAPYSPQSVNLTAGRTGVAFYLNVADKGAVTSASVKLTDSVGKTAQNNLPALSSDGWNFVLTKVGANAEAGFDFNAVTGFELTVEGLPAGGTVLLDDVRIVDADDQYASIDPAAKDDGSLPDPALYKLFRNMDTTVGWTGVSNIVETPFESGKVNAFILGDSSYGVWNTAQVQSSLQTPVDLSEFDPYYLTLSCWVYISSPELVDYVGKEYDNYGLKGAAFELTGRRNWYDGNGFNWSMKTLNVKAGWNRVSLRLKDVASGDFDYNNINYFRWYVFYDTPADSDAEPMELAVFDVSFTESALPSMVTGYSASPLDTSGRSPYPVYPKSAPAEVNADIPSFPPLSGAEKTLSVIVLVVAGACAAVATAFTILSLVKNRKKNKG